MSHKKVKECKYCRGSGFGQNALMEQIPCIECGGTGTVDAKEARKTVALPMSIYMPLSRLAHQHEITRVQLIKKMVKEYENRA